MLQSILAALPRTGIREAEKVLRQSWSSLLKLKDEARTRFCADAECFLERQVAKKPAPTDSLAILTIIYVTAVHVIHSGLAAPVRWVTAQDSPFRSSAPVERSSPSRAEAARVVVSVCERHLLANDKVASVYFGNLLHETAMGVPLLALVLRAYGEATVDVLSAHSEGPRYLQSCIDHLALATRIFTEGTSDGTLTIAHPILLHVARVSGCTEAAMQLLSRPIYSVSPMLTGISLSDYVAYYAEAALMLAAQEQYESAMYALVPVCRLPSALGTSVGEMGSPCEPCEGDVPPWLDDLEDEEAVVGADNSLSALQPLLLYPWYRAKPVGATRKYTSTTEGKVRSAKANTFAWGGILPPSAIEHEIDRRAVAWASRLGMVLLSVAFGGGSPRGVMALTESLGRRSADDEEAQSLWSGMASAIAGHVCFPHPLFEILAETTPVSLDSFVRVTTRSRATSERVYADFLVAIARRDTENARRCLVDAANVALFTADLTLDLVEAAVLHQLPRHILLDVARMYAHVSMEMLLDRTQLTRVTLKAIDATSANEGAEEEARALDPATKDSRHALVQLLVNMCATGDLASSHVCVTAVPTASTAAMANVAVYSVEEVAKQLSSGTASFSVTTASVKWTLPSSTALLQRCAQVVQLHIHQCSRASSDTSLLPMLAQLQELQRVLDADAARIVDVETV
ncbi:hypothetical protein CUR178_00259 [Leishmania enriettii]|uniref:Uncharacterized protein n=1 Tax=Leishmania enriettii TaxID=5663 RepID=A0A836G3I9_LEIEN|nr:hypothetical protein CUR178_00259 [Leishmania enriettii]